GSSSHGSSMSVNRETRSLEALGSSGGEEPSLHRPGEMPPDPDWTGGSSSHGSSMSVNRETRAEPRSLESVQGRGWRFETASNGRGSVIDPSSVRIPERVREPAGAGARHSHGGWKERGIPVVQEILERYATGGTSHGTPPPTP